MLLPDLIRQAVQARGPRPRGRRYRIRRVGRPTYPTASAVAYAGALEHPARDLVHLVEVHLIANAGGLAAAAAAARQHDEYGQTLDDIINLVGTQFSQQWPPQEIERLAREQAIKLSEKNRQQLTRILSNSLGVPIFFQDGWAAPEISTWVKTNAGLITSLADQHLSDVRAMVTGSIRSGRTVQDVTRDIRERYAQELAGKPKNRAELIARDQVGKFYGNANQLRQRELGVERYVWRGVLDERERDSHREKEGNLYRWDDPPADTGHPGEDYQCRCTGEPYLADAVPEDIQGREEIMRDIARQQETLQSRERVEASPAPAPEVKLVSSIAETEETPEDISAKVFGRTTIEGGSKEKRALVNTTIQAIAQKLGSGSPATLLPGIIIKRTTRYEGAIYRDAYSGKISELVINSSGEKHHSFSLAHEIGHVVDARDAIRKGFDTSWWSSIIDASVDPNLLKVMETIKSSPEVDWIKKKLDPRGEILPISSRFQRYLLSSHELFARAFSQYMAIETGMKSMKDGLDEIREKAVYYQWADKHFKPIRQAMKKYLEGRK